MIWNIFIFSRFFPIGQFSQLNLNRTPYLSEFFFSGIFLTSCKESSFLNRRLLSTSVAHISLWVSSWEITGALIYIRDLITGILASAKLIIGENWGSLFRFTASLRLICSFCILLFCKEAFPASGKNVINPFTQKSQPGCWLNSILFQHRVFTLAFKSHLYCIE